MFLLTILNPFLTREARTTGFEGVATEICLIQQVQTKTNSMHTRQDRVLGEVSWTRGQCQKHECRSQQADVHGFELPARTTPHDKMALVLLSQTSRMRSPRALATHNVDDTSPPDQRWASADLSHGPAYKSRPGLCTRQGPHRGAELRRRIDNVSSRWCEQGPSEVPASPLLPSRLEARLPNSVLSASPCRPPFPLPQKGRLDVQAASQKPTAGSQHSTFRSLVLNH